MSILKTQNILMFAAIQDALGTPEYPVAADGLRMFEATFKVPPMRTLPSPERTYDSYELHKILSAGYDFSALTMQVPIMPGIYPAFHGRQLLTAAMGVEDVDAPNHKYTYTQRKPSTAETFMTFACRFDTLCQWYLDTVCESFDTPFKADASKEGQFCMNFNFKALRHAFAGTDALKVAGVKDETHIEVYFPQRFTVDAVIRIDTDVTDYTITAVDYVTGVIGISPKLLDNELKDVAVFGYLPTPTPPVADLIYMGNGFYKEDGSELGAMEGTLNYSHPVNAYWEKFDTLFPTQLLRAGKVDAKINVKHFLMAENVDRLLWPRNKKQIEIDIYAGSEDGDRFVNINAPVCEALEAAEDNTPDDGGQVNMQYQCLGTSGGDAVSITVQCAPEA